MNRFDLNQRATILATKNIAPAIARRIPRAAANAIHNLDDGSHSPASVSFLLGTGGDRRIWPDAITRRNRYGTRATPSDDEISFSSTTASNVSREGFLAARVELERLTEGASPFRVKAEQWFIEIRDRIANNLGCAESQVILAPSGTDAELLAICMIAGISKRPLTNVIVAPDETGNGVPRAAAGRHFSDLTALGHVVEVGATLQGLPKDRIEVRTIAIRDESGKPRHQHDIDADMIETVELELRRNRDVVVHVLDTSKTGLSALTRQAARHVAALAPGRVQIIVDACQFRGSIFQLRQDLADGFVVALTGSKFIGGPPFSGALLIPSAMTEGLAAGADIPAGLTDYTAAQDWPAALRRQMTFAFKSDVNIGMGLRWAAARAILDSYSAIDEIQQRVIKEEFVRVVRSRIDAVKGLFLHQDDDGAHLSLHAMVPLTVTNGAGSFASLEECQNVQRLMRDLNEGPICHMGQAVCLGPRNVLRVAASARDVIDVAAGMSMGQSMSQAFGSIESRLDATFQKLSAVLQLSRGA